jgi:hypothetical protein
MNICTYIIKIPKKRRRTVSILRSGRVLEPEGVAGDSQQCICVTGGEYALKLTDDEYGARLFF